MRRPKGKYFATYTKEAQQTIFKDGRRRLIIGFQTIPQREDEWYKPRRFLIQLSNGDVANSTWLKIEKAKK